MLLNVIIKKYNGLKKTRPSNILLFIKSEHTKPKTVNNIEVIHKLPPKPKKYSGELYEISKDKMDIFQEIDING